MKKIIEVDKVKHFLVSAGLVILLNLILPLWLAVAVVAILGIAKELSDKSVDVWDLVADATGILIGVGVCLI